MNWYLQIKTIAVETVFRIRDSGELKHDHIGYNTVLREMSIFILVQGTDYLLPKLNFERTFGISIPLREDINILSLDIYKSNFIAKSTLRLRESCELKHKHIEHNTILREMSSSISF